MEEETKLIDGLPYDIDLNQNFSFYSLDGHPIEEVSVHTLLKFITNVENADTMPPYADCSTPSAEDYQRTQELWECLYNDSKKRRKLEKKWKNKRPKTIKEAEKNFNLALEKIMEGK